MDKRRAFLQILWGMLFIVVDINVGIDVVPDLVGYFLIVFALQRLEADDVNFRAARIYTIIGAVISVLLIVPFSQPLLRQLLSIAQTVCEVLFTWYLCTGIMRLAEARGNAQLTGSAATSRLRYIAVAIISMGVGAFAQIASLQVPVVVAIVLVVFSLITGGLVMITLWEAAKEFTAAP